MNNILTVICVSLCVLNNFFLLVWKPSVYFWCLVFLLLFGWLVSTIHFCSTQGRKRMSLGIENGFLWKTLTNHWYLGLERWLTGIALAEDFSFVPSSQVGGLTSTSSSRKSDISYGAYANMWYSHIQANIYKEITIINKMVDIA